MPQTVLIADDDPLLLQLLRTTLRTLPIRIIEADNGLDAMNLIEQEKPDLVVTDYIMPAWDGLEVCHRIREQSDLKQIKVALITGHGTLSFLLEAVNHGVVDAALSKPFRPAELIQLVQRLLALHPASA